MSAAPQISQTMLKPPTITGSAIAILRDREAIRAFEAEWRGFYQATANSFSTFQSPEWCLAWLDANPEANVLLCCRYQDDQLTGLLPLLISEQPGVRIAGMWGALCAEYAVPLVKGEDPSAFVSEIVAALRDEGIADLLQIDGLTEATELNSDEGAITEIDASFVCDLSEFETYETYFASKSSNSRSNIKRNWKKLAKQGDVEVKTDRVTSNQLNALYPTLAKWKHEWLYDNAVFGGAYDSGMIGSIYASLAGRGNDEVHLRIVAILLNDEPIACNTYYADGQVLHCVGVYRDTSVGGISIGGLMQDAAVRFTLENGYNRIDYGLGENEDKRRNSNEKIARYQLICALSAKGRLAQSLGIMRLRDLAKSAFYQLPKQVRQQIMALRGD